VLGWLYPRIRSLVKRLILGRQRRRHQPNDFESVVEVGQGLYRLSHAVAGRWLYPFSIPAGIHRYLYDLTFPSPLVISSFEGHLEMLEMWSGMGMGGVICKTVLWDERAGNARPRLLEVVVPPYTQPALLNAMGLPGKGVQRFCMDLARSRLLRSGKPVGISIGGTSATEYTSVFDYVEAAFSDVSLPLFYEVNISCPNTPEGQSFFYHPELLHQLLTDMRKKSDRVIGVKLSPDQSNEDLLRFADLVKSVPRTYLNLGNTQYKPASQWQLSKADFPKEGGGLSGAPLFPRTLEMVTFLARKDIPLMATGGISNIDQVKALLDAGATLVGIATALVQNPYCVPEINQELATQK
jgi:dihydroorotate dehydrogenase